MFSSAGYTKLPFKWFDYLREMGSVAAPVKLFNKVRLLLGFSALSLGHQFFVYSVIWWGFFFFSTFIHSPVSRRVHLISKEKSSPPITPLLGVSSGGAQSWFPTGHEAWGCRPHGASSGVRCYGDEDCAPATENPLWRLGRRVWPVGWLWVSRPLPCGLVSANRLPAPTSRITE